MLAPPTSLAVSCPSAPALRIASRSSGTAVPGNLAWLLWSRESRCNLLRRQPAIVAARISLTKRLGTTINSSCAAARITDNVKMYAIRPHIIVSSATASYPCLGSRCNECQCPWIRMRNKVAIPVDQIKVGSIS